MITISAQRGTTRSNDRPPPQLPRRQSLVFGACSRSTGRSPPNRLFFSDQRTPPTAFSLRIRRSPVLLRQTRSGHCWSRKWASADHRQNPNSKSRTDLPKRIRPTSALQGGCRLQWSCGPRENGKTWEPSRVPCLRAVRHHHRKFWLFQEKKQLWMSFASNVRSTQSREAHPAA